MLSTDNHVSSLLDDLSGYLADEPPALSLPPSAYTSTELWELERDRIFGRSWMLVAHVDQLAETGDYVCVSIAGEAVVVTRAGNGELYASSPICRLPQFAVAVWNGLVWVNLDTDADPIGPHLDLAADEFANYRLDEMVQVDSWMLEWRANWKLAMEDGHENYHVLGLHRETLEPFMPGGGDIYVRSYSPWVLHARIPFVAPVEPESLTLNDIQKRNGMVLLAFPTSAFIGLADQVVWLSFIPLTIDRIQVIGGVLTTPEGATGSESAARTQQAVTAMINDEDRMGLEAVQRGVGSRFAQRGHLSPKEQPGVLAFYRNLAHALLA